MRAAAEQVEVSSPQAASARSGFAHTFSRRGTRADTRTKSGPLLRIAAAGPAKGPERRPRAAPAPPSPGDTAAQCGGGGGRGEMRRRCVCVEPPSRVILRRHRPESAARRTRCQRRRLRAGSRRLARVGPGRSTDLAGLARPGRMGWAGSGRARQNLPGRKGPDGSGARKSAAEAGLGSIGRAGRVRVAAAPESRRRR